MEDLRTGKVVARRYRNRQIGNIIKELKLTEGKCTGIPTILKAMSKNGSPEPSFEADEERSSLIVTLPIHKSFLEVDFATLLLTPTAVQFLRVVKNIPMPLSQIADIMQTKPTNGSLRRAVTSLLQNGLIAYTIPNKPNSRFQRYILTPLGEDYLRFEEEFPF